MADTRTKSGLSLHNVRLPSDNCPWWTIMIPAKLQDFILEGQLHEPFPAISYRLECYSILPNQGAETT
jgi:hypothetical protein